jgi:hypothetical protein
MDKTKEHDDRPVYYVSTAIPGQTDGQEEARLIRANSKAAARSQVLSIITVRKATPKDMELAIPPNTLKIEDSD